MKTIKILLLAAFALGSTSLFAQKFGRIDYGSIIFAMPEIASVNESMEKVRGDFQVQLEELEVEMNVKYDALQKLPSDTAESVKQLRQRELADLQTRQQEFLQSAQQSLEQTQAELMLPLKQKADAAIKKICKAQGIVAVFQATDPEVFQIGELVYLDEASSVDITAAVRTELGITATPTLPVQQ